MSDDQDDEIEDCTHGVGPDCSACEMRKRLHDRLRYLNSASDREWEEVAGQLQVYLPSAAMHMQLMRRERIEDDDQPPHDRAALAADQIAGVWAAIETLAAGAGYEIEDD